MAALDIKLYFGISPGVIIPLSERAKGLLDLPEGVDGMLILDDPSKVMAMLPEDYLVGMTEEPPAIITVCTLERLH